MIHSRQEEWLFSGLKNTKADFIFVVSSVNLAVQHDNGAWYRQGSAGAGKDDGWTAHLQQCERIVDFAASLVKPVIFLTGDLHRSFVARITPGYIILPRGHIQVARTASAMQADRRPAGMILTEDS